MTFEQLIQSTVDYANAPAHTLRANVPANLRFTVEVEPGVDIFADEIASMDPTAFSRKVTYTRPELEITFTVAVNYSHVWYSDGTIRSVKTYEMSCEERRIRPQVMDSVARHRKTAFSEEGVYEAITQTILWK